MPCKSTALLKNSHFIVGETCSQLKSEFPLPPEYGQEAKELLNQTRVEPHSTDACLIQTPIQWIVSFAPTVKKLVYHF